MSKRRTQTERREESEKRLLIAAAELIAREGPAAASLERIGREAGYSRGLASHKFGSKDGLFDAVMTFLSDRLEEKVAERLLQSTTQLDRIQGYVETLLTHIGTDIPIRAYFVMMASSVSGMTPSRSDFCKRNNAVREMLRRAIAEGQRNGEFDAAIDADMAALSIGSLMLGIAVELLIDPDLDPMAMQRTILPSIAIALGAGGVHNGANQVEGRAVG